MLDVHRAQSKHMKLELGPTDVPRDVLQPVSSILFMRGAKVDIQLDCPEELVVNSDRMRLKQIILNLAANATKFVQVGFIRLRAAVVDGNVELYVEDSGPGIPPEKRNLLFARFQESLDQLNQGTGIGLNVCKTLCELMGADIYLDETFDSGVEGYPGTRFVIKLNQSVLLDIEGSSGDQTQSESDMLLNGTKGVRQNITSSSCQSLHSSVEVSSELPEALSVLFVDDDMVLSQDVFSCCATDCSQLGHSGSVQRRKCTLHGRLAPV